MKENFPKLITDLIFDLDDTLLNTSQDIVPQTIKLVYEKMKSKGLGLSFEEFELERIRLAKSYSHREIFMFIANENCQDKKYAKACADAGTKLFYNPDLPQQLNLMKDALPVILASKKQGYHLHLITSGVAKVQQKKIQALSIEKYFESVQVVGFEPKTAAIKKLLSIRKIPANQILSFGNRLSHEIRDSKSLGAWTCYFAFGDHLGEQPQTEHDHPDFQISNWKELASVCPFLKLNG